MTDTDPAEAAPHPEFRPSWAAFHRRLLSRMLLLGPLLLLVLIVASWPSLGLALVMLGGAMAIGGIALTVYFGRAWVRVEGGVIRVRGPFRTRSWSLADIAALVMVPQPGTPPTPPGRERPLPGTLYAVSPMNERLFWLSGDFWERPVLDEIAQATGLDVHEVPRGLPAQEVRTRYPGTVGWTAVRPWLLALVVAVSSALLMLVILVITTAVLLTTGQLQIPGG